jgi:predicted nuclease of predicted toxin-antitoxin system
MKLLIDMNLSPAWVDFLARHGWDAVHWSTIGDPRADDRTIMTWARDHGYAVFTHDLDFGTILAATRAEGPSVVQIRAQDVLPVHLGPIVLAALQQFREDLTAGALVTVDERTSRARILPINR